MRMSDGAFVAGRGVAGSELPVRRLKFGPQFRDSGARVEASQPITRGKRHSLQSIPSRPTPQDKFSTCPNPLPDAGQALRQRHDSSGVA